MNLDRELMLASVEEDNVQRAYFRVHPLLTVEGMVQEEALKQWPNEGCLRIVPDRAEQHTFKDRMRQLGGWCLVDLTKFAPEANKIRTNKNFHPDRGEINQYILYSDTVSALPDRIFYEVLAGKPEEAEALAAKAITPKFYVQDEDVLYGPVDRAQPAKPDTAPAAEAVLYEIAAQDGAAHRILCIAAELPERPVFPEPAEQPAENKADEQQAESKPAAAKQPLPQPVQRVAERSAKAPEKQAVKPEAEEALPIGQALNILDQRQTFEETLTDLNQPVSGGANLLRHSSAQTAMQQEAPKLTGTPLYRSNVRTSSPQPKNKLQEVVYSQQCRVVRNDPPADPLPAGCTMRRVDNPVEKACEALRDAWAVPEAQDQLINCMLSLDGIVKKLEPHASRAYTGSALQSALQSRLNELEAERLTALVQLDKARAELETFRKASIETAAEQTRKQLNALQSDKTAMIAAVDELRSQINALVAEREALAESVNELQQEAIPASLAKLLGDCAVTMPVRGSMLRLSPVCGQRAEMADLLARLEVQCESSGVKYQRNAAIALLVAMTVCDRVGLVSKAPAATATLAGNMARALGWQTGFAVQQDEHQIPVISTAPVNATPIVMLTMLPDATPMTGVCKMLLTTDAKSVTESAAYRMNQWPLVPVSAADYVPMVEACGEPVAAAVISDLVKETCVEREHLDRIMMPMMKHIAPLSGEACEKMYSFINGCAHWMDGGLPSAIDWALLLWVMPALDLSPEKKEAIMQLLSEYPKCQAML